MADLQAHIEELWARQDELGPGDGDASDLVHRAVGLLDSGEARVAEVDPASGRVIVHEWLKQAILLLFRVSAMETIEAGPFVYADKLPLKRDFARAGVRAVPGASARWGSYLERGVILMPSYVNIGARVGANTMVDTWATVGSCAQVGANVHLSGGVGIGGVLEPPQAAPVVIEDDCMIGSRSMVTEGSDAETGEEISRGEVPSSCVAVTANRRRQYAGGEFFLPCVLVVKRLEEGRRHDKAQLNAILRHEGLTT